MGFLQGLHFNFCNNFAKNSNKTLKDSNICENHRGTIKYSTETLNKIACRFCTNGNDIADN